ncbi:class I SAM-dependent methyltransferase [Gordonia desulfuricans]|uniref:class I SAM-dependent methyltransferase n=1 Tax=Gordonia desulfuricans TaxID=89051 RepID=UPI0027D8029D|nr:class I SAM-dependent methyltransferase [Gordonia desulfuricans]
MAGRNSSSRGAQISAGMLVYRWRDDSLEVLIAHPGGPLWARKDDGAWTIPKGLAEPGEDLLGAARREFAEEIGSAVPEGPVVELGEVRLTSGKRVTGYAVEGDLDVSTITSNTFEMVWPPRSGKVAQFPEIDRAGWFALADAAVKLNPAQAEFLTRLTAALDDVTHTEIEDPGSRLAGVFNSAADDFDAVTPQVWGPAGEALIAALDPRAGEAVIDICSGTGASVLPAAKAVGPDGRVLAVDFSAALLDVARAKAGAEGLGNVDVAVADVTTLEPGITPCENAFDVLACAFGVFFLPEMDDAARGLLRLVRPGGKVGVSVWHADAMADFAAAYFATVGEIAGDTGHQGPRAPGSGPRPIDRINTEETLAAWLSDVGGHDVAVTTVRLRVACTPEFAWKLVLGSGYRGALTELDDETRRRIRDRFVERLAAEHITEVNCDTLIATARV